MIPRRTKLVPVCLRVDPATVAELDAIAALDPKGATRSDVIRAAVAHALRAWREVAP